MPESSDVKLPPVPPARYEVWDDYYEGYVLHPLPEDRFDSVKLYTVADMQAYGEECARRAVEAELERALAEISRLQEHFDDMDAPFGWHVRDKLDELAAAIRRKD